MDDAAALGAAASKSSAPTPRKPYCPPPATRRRIVPPALGLPTPNSAQLRGAIKRQTLGSSSDVRAKSAKIPKSPRGASEESLLMRPPPAKTPAMPPQPPEMMPLTSKAAPTVPTCRGEEATHETSPPYPRSPDKAEGSQLCLAAGYGTEEATYETSPP